ncbi:MAG TPA: hypothetical protein VMD97_04150 [Candidatus Aquilonibacter sp.]|nr:hypothetical protein [Candidatus Aquilonibacter sp.]
MKLPLVSVCSTLLCIPSVLAQTPAPTQPELSPKAAYTDAMQPLESTRAQVANWSDAEIAALKVTIGRAAEQCQARHPEDFDGDPLIDLAKLCALGQAWPAVVQSTTRYINAKDNSKPRLGEAYAAQIDAELHLKDHASALAGAQAMLSAVRYDALTAETIDEVLAYMQFAYTADAVSLAELREPLLLANIKSAATSSAQSAVNDGASQAIHELYDDGLALAALQQLAGEMEDARATVSQLDAALPAALNSDDLLPITASRRRYALLGHPLPQLRLTGYLRHADPLPEIPATNAITALLLFPDWCAQCVRMGKSFPETVFTVAGHEAYLYGMLDETVQPNRTLSSDGFNPADSSLLLQQTPTLVIPGADLDRFAVNGFPFLVITDAHGIVRVAQPIDPNAIQPGNTIDTAIACIGDHWPLRRSSVQKTASRTPHAPATSRTHPPTNSLH